MLPSHFYNAHQSAIRSLTWVRAPTHSADAEITSDEPTVLISAGYDGILHAKDMRSPCGNDVSRTRGIYVSVSRRDMALIHLETLSTLFASRRTVEDLSVLTKVW